MTIETIHSLHKLPERTRRERDCSKAVSDRLGRLPFAVKTPGISTPTPQIVAMTQPEVEVFRQPYPRLRETVWLFPSEDARSEFLKTYVGEAL